ncbi:MAG: hypothetical protein MJZ82_03010 [Paludibacteraceae bacterium]|nr:hypothetical protein [Paludibacteraceae bacterium]
MADKFSLPGIKSIGYLLANQLESNIAMRAQAGIPIVIPRPNKMDFAPEPTPECSCLCTNANNGCTEKVKLSFTSQTLLSPEADYAFVVTDCHNCCYLIGAMEAPFPVMNRTTAFGSPAGEPRSVAYEIEFASIRALIPCHTS